MPWTIYESKQVTKAIAKAPKEIVQKYEAWQAIVRFSGPDALRLIPGMHDEALSGEWAGYRSSRLSLQWRVIYLVQRDEVAVYVERVTPHDYRR